jgi:thiamine-phosphate pyrophosphorylase
LSSSPVPLQAADDAPSPSGPQRDFGAALTSARLYLITGARPDLAELIEASVRGGVGLVQLREKELSDRDLLDVLGVARAVTRRLGVPLVVNDRPDLAVLCDADCVHVGQDDLPVSAARRFGLPVGVSTHAPDEIDGAHADYLGVGPVFATPTKEGRPAVGVDLVRYAAANASAPWFAIGGIDRTNIERVVRAGATRIAVVRALVDAADPEDAARELRAALP